MKNIQKKCHKKSQSKEIKKIIDFLKIISDEHRLKILCFLNKGEKCVCEIWQYIKIRQNLASHHLKVLKDFGLLSSRREGLKIYYKLEKKVVEKYLNLLNKFLKV